MRKTHFSPECTFTCVYLDFKIALGTGVLVRESMVQQGRTLCTRCVLFTSENNTERTDGPTDGRTDLRTDRHDLI